MTPHAFKSNVSMEMERSEIEENRKPKANKNTQWKLLSLTHLRG